MNEEIKVHIERNDEVIRDINSRLESRDFEGLTEKVRSHLESLREAKVHAVKRDAFKVLMSRSLTHVENFESSKTKDTLYYLVNGLEQISRFLKPKQVV